MRQPKRPEIGQPYSEYTLEFETNGIQRRETRYSAETLLRLAMDTFPKASIETNDQRIVFYDAAGNINATINRSDHL